MSALRKVQFEHDERLPPPVSKISQEVARSEWLYNAAEELARGGGLVFKRHMHSQQGVTAYSKPPVPGINRRSLREANQ
ncbi:hypothetical protein [Pseudomonas mucidolens]|uniref:hypothetical protein n=1 Tax=Pseudomonas mucidolens TaxID=46679 RepID=UPI0030D941BD